MVDVAIKAKADAIKFQTFVTDDMQLMDSKKPRYQNKLRNQSYYKIIKNLEPSFDDQKKIFRYCKKRGILFLSTPYDVKSVDFLDELGVTAFKIASTDLTNHILLKHVISKKKPILLSTGLADIVLVKQAIRLFEQHKMKNKLILLQTTSDYPTPELDVNLNVIPEYMKKFNTLTGYSDHTSTGIAACGAIVLGAKVIEKHFTLNKKFFGPDHSSSLEPNELTNWIHNIRLIENSMGSNKKIITNSEKRNLSMRKYLVIQPIKKNAIITLDLLTAKRGMKNKVLPLEKNLKKIIGKKINQNILTPTEFDWKMINHS